MEQRNKFCVGDTVEVMRKDGTNQLTKVVSITDLDGKVMESCPHPQQMLYVTFEHTPECMDIIRMKEA